MTASSVSADSPGANVQLSWLILSRGCPNGKGQIQRQRGICIRAEFQGPPKFVAFLFCLALFSATVASDTFTRHSIERSIPVEALIKCKMQDNLEFLQWTKRFWDQYYPGGEYDAIARRKASGAAPAAVNAPSRPSVPANVRRGVTPTSGAAKSTRSGGGSGGSAALSAENSQLKETVTGLERERDFYFSKLRDIELLLQHAVELDPEIEKDEEGLVKQIQAILYSTEVRCRTQSSCTMLTVATGRI